MHSTRQERADSANYKPKGTKKKKKPKVKQSSALSFIELYRTVLIFKRNITIFLFLLFDMLSSFMLSQFNNKPDTETDFEFTTQINES